MQFDKYKKKAKELGLEYLSNIPWVEGHYTLEKYADGNNPTVICFGNTWKQSLGVAEKALKNGTVAEGSREMRGIGEGVKNFEDYEIRVLRIEEGYLFEGKKYRVIELSVGKKGGVK